MKAFVKHLLIQMRMDIRERNVLLTYYLVPLVFYLVMGAVFSSINPASKQTLCASMSIFAVTMGAVLGIPAPLIQLRQTGALRAFRTNGVPGASILLAQAGSALIHILVSSSVIILSAPVLFGAERPAHPAAFFGILVLLIVTSLTLGLLIGVVAKNGAMSVMLSQAVFLPSLMLGGLMFPAAMLPDALRIAGRIFPATFAMQSFLAVGFSQSPDIALPTALTAMAAIALIGSIVVALRFRMIAKS
jgi:ABC-2 type transport system permease protein